ncbi:NAD-dependent protein deacetylase [Corynebacterium yudongzhengii]|uniref:NAD-dependent protein deacetylase n=1 Tax=Corynebacterium yudongzhengii TaxID=2080740 RepID=A0A2U1T4L0_9CORY|nr:Sir2 family NAD-dependent protein deacetylase [Corynebacterium yudongzhengii]AWB80982.1 NAD-dependent protein deacetylase [Corynebacterium yudongzhengii]PWC00905.1 NAD-dependent protein deacetylase [Corynebacterium yudongzhengii]
MSSFSDPAIARAHASALRSIARVVEEKAAPTPADIALERVVAQLRSGPALVLTGAGVSTDSGIPDYRGPTGKLTKGRPMTYQEFLHDPAASHRYWARSFVGWRAMTQAAPNRTHYALVELERAGYITGVITQNVDGLHEAAGSGNVLTIHGDMGHVVCLDCGHREIRAHFDDRMDAANPGYLSSLHITRDMVNPDGDVALPDATVAQFRMPGCQVCGSVRLKPDVVYFGESVPRARRAAGEEMLAAASSLVVVGSSLAVMSGYRFVIDARRQGKEVAVINGGPGRGDHKATTLWRTGVGEAFDQVLDALEL